MLTFETVRVGETIVLPGRIGKPDLWEVARKYGNRIVLESVLTKGHKRVMMSNQFNAAGFEEVVPDVSGYATAALAALKREALPIQTEGEPLAADELSYNKEAEPEIPQEEEDAELAELKRKYGD